MTTDEEQTAVEVRKGMSEFYIRRSSAFGETTQKLVDIQIETQQFDIKPQIKRDEERKIIIPQNNPVGPPGPTVSSVSPVFVATVGGDTITIVGTNFFKGPNGEVPTVKTGPNSATNVVWVNNQKLTCTTPPDLPGSVRRVVVKLYTGQESTDDVTIVYQYRPIVTSITPNSGPTSGGTLVIVTGSGFGEVPPGGAQLFIGSQVLSGAVHENAGRMHGTTNPGSAGAKDVKVTNQFGLSGSLIGGFLYSDPTPPPPPPPETIPAAFMVDVEGALTYGNPVYWPQFRLYGASFSITARDTTDADFGPASVQINYNGTLNLTYGHGSSFSAVNGPSSVTLVNGRATVSIGVTVANPSVTGGDVILSLQDPAHPSIPYHWQKRQNFGPIDIHGQI